MAVFMTNICTFNGCGIIFPNLIELIWHIEEVHIDYDPVVLEQKEASQPSSVPLSYVKRFLSEAARRQLQSLPPTDARRRVLPAPKTPSVRSNTPTGSEIDEDELMTPSEDSNDSWTTVEEYSSDFILRYGVKMNVNATSGALGPAAQEKPFACPVPGCKKRYKNVNGIKYHSKNGHKKDGKIKKAYKCQCGKSYKTAQGLKSHSIIQHMTSPKPAPPAPPAPAPAGERPKVAALVVTSSPAAHRPLAEGIDPAKVVRIYDGIKKELPAFAVPKHALATLGVVSSSNAVRQSVLLTPSSTPGSSPVDKAKYERSPKVSAQPLAPIYENAN